jgi:hypothetical protein
MNERGHPADPTRKAGFRGESRSFIRDPCLTGTRTVSTGPSHPKVRQRETLSSAIVDRSQVRSDGPGRALDNRSSRHAGRTTTPLPPMTTGRAMRSNTRVAAQAQIACGAPERTKNEHTMMSRTATATYAGRASSMRRLRRRATAANADGRPFCRTNGCPSFLELDRSTGIATCPVCAATQRPRSRRAAH